MNRTARIILATGVALTVTLPIFGGVASAAPAGGSGSADTTTVETTVVVREGDSLAGVAWRHGVRLAALLRANSLQLTSVIHPGDTLVIPRRGNDSHGCRVLDPLRAPGRHIDGDGVHRVGIEYGIDDLRLRRPLG
jgi:hypothetical protein